jgi:hypothetical protein
LVWNATSGAKFPEHAVAHRVRPLKGLTPEETDMSRAAAMPGGHEHRETHDLIGSDKVEGTNVYRSNGDKVGSIERIMIDKYSGKVAYAVMSFGGFLGIGHDHYPVPWARLDYNEKLGGYEMNISEQELKGAPKFAAGSDWSWDETKGKEVYDYYRIRPYWI